MAKLSSENFAALVYDFNNQKELEKLKDSITQAFQQRLLVNDHSTRVEVNLGVTTFPENSEEVTKLLLFAEYATLQSKQKGKNQTTFFYKELSESFHEALLIEKELADALKKKEFFLMYQPQIDSALNKL